MSGLRTQQRSKQTRNSIVWKGRARERQIECDDGGGGGGDVSICAHIGVSVMFRAVEDAMGAALGGASKTVFGRRKCT